MGWVRSRFAAILVGGLVIALAAAACTSNGDDDTAPAEDAALADAAGPTGEGQITVVSYNVLHGLPLGNCPDETDFCNAGARLEMMWELVEREADCPDVIALQEVGPAQTELIPGMLDDVCDGRYSLASELMDFPVEQWVLTSLPVLDSASEQISGAIRSIQWTRLDSALGPVDFYTTHFVAGVDNFPCDEDNCATGIAAGICDLEMETGECNPLETLDFIERTVDDATLTILTGDLNAAIDDDRVVTITDTGFVDVWALADLSECDPETGGHCTSGQGGDGPYDGLDIAENTRGSRIDFVLVRGPEDCDVDADPDRTGIFAGEAFDPPVEGLYWPSDHTGVRAAITCA